MNCRAGLVALGVCIVLTRSTVLEAQPNPRRLVLDGVVAARESLQAPPSVPIAGARVELVAKEMVLASSTTDSRGAFRIDVALSPGTYTVRTVCRGTSGGKRIEPAEGDSLLAQSMGYSAKPDVIEIASDAQSPGRREDRWLDVECYEYTLLASNDPLLRRFFGPGVEEPWRETTKDKEQTTLTVYYATDRNRLSRTGDYGTDRSQDGSLSLGRLQVRIPPSHRTAEIERPKWWHLELRENPDEHIVITARTADDYATFYRELKGDVRRSSSHEALVFIHGFNVTFDEAAFRTAQLAHDLSFAGPSVMYSWPSEGGVLPYPHDITNSERTIPALREFLRDLSKRTGATRIHLIAHSRGTYALGRAVGELAKAEGRLYKNIILLAPDIDAAIFRDQIAPAIASDSQRVTLYASSRDRALMLSKVFNGGDRAGDSYSPVVVRGVDTIDATNVETDWLGHSLTVPSVLWDIFDLLKNGAPPGKRFGLKQAITAGGGAFWTFKLVHSG